MNKKKRIGIVLGGIALLIFLWVLFRKKADPAGYVQANLDLVFQGDTSAAVQYLDGSSSELEEVYEEGVRSFTDQYLMGEMDAEGTYTEAFDRLVKEVFAIMRYQVESVKKNGALYEVTVIYQPVDVFPRFVPQLREESLKIQQALNSGGYAGTEEEAQQSALQDYLYFAYETLEMAYLEAEYGEKETFTFRVKAGMSGACSIQEDGMNTFMEQILALDNL